MPDAITAPEVGTRLPALEVHLADGVRVALDGITAGRRALVHFMRSSTCPVCLAHGATIERMRAAGQIPDDVVVVFLAPGGLEGAAEAARRLAGRRVEVAATGAGHADVGLGRFLALQHSGTFVLDVDGAVLSAVTSAIPTASFSRTEVVRVFGQPGTTSADSSS